MAQEQSLAQIFTDPRAMDYFSRLCGSEQAGQAFVQQLGRVYRQDPRLQLAEPQEVFNAAVTAAELDLPLHKVFKAAYIIPAYNDKAGKWVAQFVIGYKGLRLLAQRTGEFKRIVALPVYEGQIIRIDPVKGSKFNFAYAGGDKIVGFYAYLETHNGFRDEKFWTDGQMRRHAAKYSQDYHDENSIWHSNYAGMGKKTILKALLNESAPLYQQVQTAIAADHSVNDTPVETVLAGQADGGFLSAAQVSHPDNPTDTSEPTPQPEQQVQQAADDNDGKMAVDEALMQIVLANVRQGLLTVEQALAHYVLTDEQQALLAVAEQPSEAAPVPPANEVVGEIQNVPPAPKAEPAEQTEAAKQGNLLDEMQDWAAVPSETAAAALTEQAGEAASTPNEVQETPKAAPKRKRKPAPKKVPPQGDGQPTTDAAETAPPPPQADRQEKVSEGPQEDDDPISASIGQMMARWRESAPAEPAEQEAAPSADNNTPLGNPKDHTWQAVGDASATGWSAVISGQEGTKEV